MKKEIKLGMTVRDKVTGLKGTASLFAELLSGTRQIAIQPSGKGTDYPEGRYIDDHLIEYIDDGVSRIVPPIDNSVTIRLGQKVRDIVSGFEGIAVEKLIYQNGCVHFTVQPKGKMKEEIPESISLDHKRLEVAGVGILPKIAKAKPRRNTKKPPGGPSRSMNSIRTA